MPRQIYRFEILNELARRGGNVTYEARDTMDGSNTQMFEWNPPDGGGKTASEIEAAKAEIGDAEIFSDRSSYYLAVQYEHAKAALTALRQRSLFTGEWANLFEDPPPPPPPMPKPEPAKPPLAIKQGYSVAWIYCTLALAVIATASVITILVGRSESESSNARIGSLNERISAMQSETERMQAELAAANANAQKAHQATSDLQADAATAVDNLFAEAEDRQVKLGLLYVPITVKNCSADEVRFAIRYRSPLGMWVTRGWWKLKPHDLNGSTWQAEDNAFYVYVTKDRNPLPLDGGQKESVDISYTLFLHEDGKPFFGGARETVKMMKAESLATIGCSN